MTSLFDGWHRFEEGRSVGQRGSEDGVIVFDEEHEAGARITIERDGGTAPFSITCGVYGSMVHTRFLGTLAEATAACREMMPELPGWLPRRRGPTNGIGNTANAWRVSSTGS